MSRWRERTVFQSSACVARKMRCRRLRTCRLALRQLTAMPVGRSRGSVYNRCRLHPTSPSICSLCPVLPGTHLIHVSTLSGRVLPYLPGYGFPVPFDWQPSLLGSSCARWGVLPSLRLAYWRERRCSCAQTPSGLPRSAPMRYDRGGCLLYSGAVVPASTLLRALTT